MVSWRNSEADLMINKILIRSLFFIFLLASSTYAASNGGSCIQNVTNIITTEQGSGIAIILMLTVIGIAIAYMAGSVTGNPRFSIFAKDELYHLGVSVLLLVGFTGLIGLSCQTMDFFFTSTLENIGETELDCYHSGDDLSTVSGCYIKLVKSDAEQMAQYYLQRHIDTMMESTFAITMQIPLFNAYTVSADSYKKVFSQQYDMVLNSFIIPALISINMQKLLLEFVNENVIRWVLPIAFLFRVFIPTRQMGNFLIALAIGLYIIVPFMYTLNLAMYDIVEDDCVIFKEGVKDFVLDRTGCNTYGFWDVGRLMPQAFFLPNLTIALVVTFMAAINKALRMIG
jgi:hypothetical protein